MSLQLDPRAEDDSRVDDKWETLRLTFAEDNMAYIPKDARWYLAEVVLEHTIENDPRNVVHVNMHLIEAGSPEFAYERAIALGRQSEVCFTNSGGKEVRVVFRGEQKGDIHR